MIRKIITSKKLQFLILMALTIVLAIFMTGDNQASLKLRHFAFDTFNRLDPREPTGEVVIVDIDEDSLKHLGQWPWSRNVLAKLVLNLKNMGAKATVFDMVFAEEDRTSPKAVAERLLRNDLITPSIAHILDALPDDDTIFAAAIKESGNVVLGFTTAGHAHIRDAPSGKVIFSYKSKKAEGLRYYVHPIKKFATNMPLFAKEAAGEGSFIALPDSDGIIREYSVVIATDPDGHRRLYPSLLLEALRIADNQKGRMDVDVFPGKIDGISSPQYTIRIGQSDWKIPINSDGRMVLKFREVESHEYIPAYQILNEAYYESIRNRIKDKIVLVGTSAEGLRDIRSTPLNAFIPGVEIHLNAIEQVIKNVFIARDYYMAQPLEASYIILFGLLLTLTSLLAGAVWMVVVAGIGIFASIWGTFYLYTHHNLLLDPANTSIAVFIIFVVTIVLNYIRSESSRREIRGAFGLYISPDFMKELTDHPDKLTLGGEIRDLTVMFTDIRNFTTISELMTPEQLINTMNDFLTPMSDVIMKTRGTIDKYMGDAIMAFWNAPLDDANHARHAVEAALAMKKSLAPINEALKSRAEKEGREPLLLAAGIGINTGPCAVGNMGSRQRFAYSALGDAVNLASRLEGQTKTYGLDLLVGEDTVQHIPDFAFVEIDLIQVKGKAEPVHIYTVLESVMLGQRESFLTFRDMHDKFLQAYRSQDFKMAMEWVGECQETEYRKILEPYYQTMTKRIHKFQINKPPYDWDGVFIATSK